MEEEKTNQYFDFLGNSNPQIIIDDASEMESAHLP